MNVLAIGNSFSQDAMRYLHRLAELAGEDVTCVNLYIGGCSLETHYCNMLFDRKAYSLEFNGEKTGFSVSIAEALASRAWDVVTLQQASHLSDDIATYTPYIEKIVGGVRKACGSQTRVLLHETWAYEEGSDRLTKTLGYSSRGVMAQKVHEAYTRAAALIEADGMIPSGPVFNEMAKAEVGPVYRDTFHASYGAGRLALAAAWLKVLTDVNDEKLRKAAAALVTDEPVDSETILRICDIVNTLQA